MRKLGWSLIVFLLCSLPAPVFAAPVRETLLPNGLRILSQEIRTGPVVSVQVWYNVGSRNESPGETGIAHQLEHLMFKGTKARPIQFGQLYNALGANANAFTSFDQTAYYATAGSAKLETLLQLEADRMTGAVIDERSLASEKTVVLSELDGRQNNPRTVLNELVLAKTFTRHPYQHTPIGERKDVEAFTVAKVRNFYKQHYGPNNATLIVVGDFDTKQLIAKVRTLFGPLKPIANLRTPRLPAEPPQTDERQVTLKRPGQVTSVQVLYRIPQASHPDSPAIDVLDTILTSGRNSRLFKAIVDKGIASNASGDQSSLADPGWYLFSLTPRSRKPEGLQALDLNVSDSQQRAVKALDAVLEEIKTSGVTEAELTRAREKTRVALIFSRDSLEQQASRLGYFQSTFGDYRLFDRYVAQLEQVTAQDIQRVLTTYFKPDSRTVGFLVPGEGPAPVVGTPPKSEANAYASGEPVNLDAVSRYLPASAAKRTALSEPVPAYAVLANGIRVQVLANRTTPTVTMLGRFAAGQSYDPPEQAGLASMVASMLDEGTTTRTAEELATLLEDQSIRFNVSAGRESVVVQSAALTEDLDLLLTLSADMLRNPVFPQKELDRIRSQFLVSLLSTLDSPAAVAQRTLYSKLFPVGHPYHAIPTEATIRALSRENLTDFYRKHYRPQNLILTIVGDVDPEKTIARVRAAFGDWQSASAEPVLAEVPVAVSARRETVVIPGKPEAQVVFGTPGLKRSDPDYYAALVMNDILGGNTLASRLGAKVRDQLGLTYGINSGYTAGTLAGPFYVSMQTNPASVERAIQAATEEIDRFRKSGPTASELDRNRRSLIDRFPLSLTSNGGLAALLQEEVTYNLGRDYPSRFVRTLEALTVEDIRRVAGRLLQPENRLTVVVGPQSVETAQKPAN